MPVFMLPEFIFDLQTHSDAHFARRVLQKTILRNGTFRENGDDHRYRGVARAWIRYISRGTTAYRVIFFRSGPNIFLFRAGEHSIETRLRSPRDEAFDAAICVTEPEPGLAESIALLPPPTARTPAEPSPDRFLRNNPTPEINRAIFSRRNLPHRDIWLVAPFIKSEFLLPTAHLGKMLYEQVEDGANVILITAPPKDLNIQWLEQLDERNIGVCLYPRLHSKLYCFVLDENRKFERGLPDPSRLSSLLLIGSANITGAGLALNGKTWNEELCYSVPDSEIDHVERYVTYLITYGYGLKEARAFLARGQWNRLENTEW